MDDFNFSLKELMVISICIELAIELYESKIPDDDFDVNNLKNIHVYNNTDEMPDELLEELEDLQDLDDLIKLYDHVNDILDEFIDEEEIEECEELDNKNEEEYVMKLPNTPEWLRKLLFNEENEDIVLENNLDKVNPVMPEFADEMMFNQEEVQEEEVQEEEVQEEEVQEEVHDDDCNGCFCLSEDVENVVKMTLDRILDELNILKMTLRREGKCDECGGYRVFDLEDKYLDILKVVGYGLHDDAKICVCAEEVQEEFDENVEPDVFDDEMVVLNDNIPNFNFNDADGDPFAAVFDFVEEFDCCGGCCDNNDCCGGCCDCVDNECCGKCCDDMMHHKNEINWDIDWNGGAFKFDDKINFNFFRQSDNDNNLVNMSNELEVDDKLLEKLVNEVLNNPVDVIWACKEGVEPPHKNEEDMGFDVRAHFEEDEFVFKPHETRLVPTGLYACVPTLWGLLAREKGSTGAIGMKCGAGVIDSGYRGEIFIAITNENDVPLVITKDPEVKKADRRFVTNWETGETRSEIVYPYAKGICQLLVKFNPKVNVRVVSVDELQSMPSLRGDGKLGSTDNF